VSPAIFSHQSIGTRAKTDCLTLFSLSLPLHSKNEDEGRRRREGEERKRRTKMRRPEEW